MPNQGSGLKNCFQKLNYFSFLLLNNAFACIFALVTIERNHLWDEF